MGWWILRRNDGTIASQVFSDVDPLSSGGGYAGGGLTSKSVSRAGDLSTEVYVDGQGWKPDVEKQRATALTLVDIARTRAETALTSRAAHDRKREELKVYASMTGAADEALADALPWLAAEAEVSQRTIHAVADEVRAAIADAETAAALLEAQYVDRKRRIRDASTAAAIRSVLAEL